MINNKKAYKIFMDLSTKNRKNQVRLSDITNIQRVWMHRKVNRKEKDEF